jgi:hypothetical protein
LGGSGAKLALSVAEVTANTIGLLPHNNEPLRKPVYAGISKGTDLGVRGKHKDCPYRGFLEKAGKGDRMFA